VSTQSSDQETIRQTVSFGVNFTVQNSDHIERSIL